MPHGEHVPCGHRPQRGPRGSGRGSHHGTAGWNAPLVCPLPDPAARFRRQNCGRHQHAGGHHGAEVQAEMITASLAAIVEFSDDAIISKDLNGVITSWNRGAERLFGYTAGEVRGKSVTLLIPPDRRREEPEILERLKRGERVDHFETVRTRKDGSSLAISLSISPLRDSSGRVIGASKIARDITERKRAEEVVRQARDALANQAAELDRLVTERTASLRETISELEHFSYTITHDMRAPLRAMQGFADLLLNEADNRLTPQSTDYLRRIIRASHRMDALIRDSLQYASAVREKIPLVHVEPAPVLRGILESYPGLQPPQSVVQVVGPLPAVKGSVLNGA